MFADYFYSASLSIIFNDDDAELLITACDDFAREFASNSRRNFSSNFVNGHALAERHVRCAYYHKSNYKSCKYVGLWNDIVINVLITIQNPCQIIYYDIIYIHCV